MLLNFIPLPGSVRWEFKGEMAGCGRPHFLCSVFTLNLNNGIVALAALGWPSGLGVSLLLYHLPGWPCCPRAGEEVKATCNLMLQPPETNRADKAKNHHSLFLNLNQVDAKRKKPAHDQSINWINIGINVERWKLPWNGHLSYGLATLGKCWVVFLAC